MAKSNFKI